MSCPDANPNTVNFDTKSGTKSSDCGLPDCSSTTCCRLGKLVMPALVLVTITSLATAAYFAGRSTVAQKNAGHFGAGFPLIDATASASSEKFSLATGAVSDDSEGLFVLDHNSGLLQCSVIYPRVGQFRALFSVNVAEALGTGGKGGSYIMVTGHAAFPRASNRPAASTVVYVMDTATGNYACYGIPFDQTAVARNQPQQGILVLISTGSANPVIDRDNLR